MVPLTTVSTPTHSDNDSGPLPTLTQLFIIFHFAVTFRRKFAYKVEQEMMLMIPMTPYREFSVKLTWNTQNLMGVWADNQKKKNPSILITLKKSKNTLSRALLNLHSEVCGLSRVKVTLSACAKTIFFFKFEEHKWNGLQKHVSKFLGKKSRPPCMDWD